MVSRFLKDVDDGLTTRPSGEYALEKLDIVNRCINMFSTAMKYQGWITSLNYIDLLAGPGKNKIRETGEIRLGSPLLALSATDPFDKYYFVKADCERYSNLMTRAASSPEYSKVRGYQDDCNLTVNGIIQDIAQVAESNPKKSSLNFVFIDPEGLEVKWKTVEKLGRQTRSDLLINFPTGWFIRFAREAVESDTDTKPDSFFGTREWRTIWSQLRNPADGTEIRRSLLDFYIARLGYLGYVVTKPVDEYIVFNSKYRQLYTLIYACKNIKGVEFFADAANRAAPGGQLKLDLNID